LPRDALLMTKFAKGYNGADYAKNSYDTKIEKAYNKFKPKPAGTK